MPAYTRAFKNRWLGQPATAQGVVPASAGLLNSPPIPMLDYVRLVATAAGGGSMAFLGLLDDARWECRKWVDASTSTVDQTAAAQAGVSNGVVLETTTQNDGVILGADMPFGAISLDVTTGGSGTTPTHVIEYWNGTAWSAIPAVGMFYDIARSSDWGGGEDPVVFAPPADWVKGGTGTGVNANRYNLRIRRTNATQATAALARRIYLGEVLCAQYTLANSGFAEFFSVRPSRYLTALGLFSAIGGQDGQMLQLFYQP